MQSRRPWNLVNFVSSACKGGEAGEKMASEKNHKHFFFSEATNVKCACANGVAFRETYF